MRFAEKARFIQKSREIQRQERILTDGVKEYQAQEICRILTELQAEAISLGNALEEQQFEAVVKKLEIYCEELYQCSLVCGETEAILEHCRKLRRLSEEIEADIMAIPVKVKIAFFPYKISMWDSLESIWEAAKHDERCECQLVPVPYYTKNSAGEFKELSYEGSKFPAEALDYSTYFLEQEKPDIMYIHNPYDQYNKVTRIDSRFFSGELKKAGGILVYVPYYMAGFSRKYEDMLSVCSNIGIVHSDYIILQSENLKDAYGYCGFPEERLLTLGSPKADAVCRILRKKYDIVEKWKTAIENRKVILLNTSISTCIQGESWLETVQRTIEPILQNDELSLIWRPHPLLWEAVKSTEKGEKQYKDFLDRIADAPNTVVDDSDTAEAAIGVSDAMISDYSSLVIQYTLTGKPAYLLTGKSEYRKYQVYGDYFSNYFREDGDCLEDFLEMVIRGNDARRKERIKYAKASIINTDGTCGKKIYQVIYKKVMERSYGF